MTSKQKKTVELLTKAIEKNDFFGYPEDHEFKKFEVIEMDNGIVELRCESGLKMMKILLHMLFAAELVRSLSVRTVAFAAMTTLKRTTKVLFFATCLM